MDDDLGAAVERTNEALRRWSAAFNDLGRQFGLHLGMHSTDAAALLQITNAEVRDAPLTQTQLARRVGLSTTATSTLLSRLEGAGHIERLRSQKDRRVVMLRSTPSVHAEVEHFFASVGEDLDAILSAYPADELESFSELLAAMTMKLDHHLEQMVTRRARVTTGGADDPAR